MLDRLEYGFLRAPVVPLRIDSAIDPVLAGWTWNTCMSVVFDVALQAEAWQHFPEPEELGQFSQAVRLTLELLATAGLVPDCARDAALQELLCGFADAGTEPSPGLRNAVLARLDDLSAQPARTPYAARLIRAVSALATPSSDTVGVVSSAIEVLLHEAGHLALLGVEPSAIPRSGDLNDFVQAAISSGRGNLFSVSAVRDEYRVMAAVFQMLYRAELIADTGVYLGALAQSHIHTPGVHSVRDRVLSSFQDDQASADAELIEKFTDLWCRAP